MRKGVFAICSVLLVLVVSIAVVVPGCGEPTPTQCTIEVEATLCDAPWQGPLEYTLTGPGAGSPINPASVPESFTVDCGNWNCAYVAEGPPGAYLEDITPSATQSVSDGGTITFTLNFELNQDAGINFICWTINDEPIPPQYSEWDAAPCQILDVHFQQWVDGCEGREVAVNETSWLQITQTQGPGPATIFAVNDWCALNKTLEPIEKVDQVPSINGDPVEPGAKLTLTLTLPDDLDVETSWQLEKCLNYTKSINWFGISKAPFVPGEEHDCVLFELVVPEAGIYQFTLVASAEVELVDDVDVNSQNDKVTSPQLTLTVWVE